MRTVFGAVLPHPRTILDRIVSVSRDRSIVDLANSCQERFKPDVDSELRNDTVLHGGRSVVLSFEEIAERQ